MLFGRDKKRTHHNVTTINYYLTVALFVRPNGKQRFPKVKTFIVGSVRVSLMIEFGCPHDLENMPWHFYLFIYFYFYAAVISGNLFSQNAVMTSLVARRVT